MQVSTDLAVTIFQVRGLSGLTFPCPWGLGAPPLSMYFSSSTSALWNLCGFLPGRAQAGPVVSQVVELLWPCPWKALAG